MSHINSVRIDTTPSLLPTSEASGTPGLRRVLTYGTFDLLHYGHIRLLQQASKLGDYLIVALSTDEFNALKGKMSFYPYEVRKEMLEAIRYVDLVIPESCWEQKKRDIEQYHVDVVCMGGDWKGDPHFESLKDMCEVVYLNRTPGISTTEVKSRLENKH
ncbi:glycerol-3-phosphate cytidylyltransferase [Parolsenella catena]|uniref:Glycerol-3-phosphate cytidylyltransferase n=1 Tax=Parolsenella catena TaxID=2003188 RepID=A0A3G9K7W2_9ACTN|nr:glycerol-3-phosphate cytidylyltransferase [Parolsenella catena]BBH50614.1 glycerol-3-phosphate cytidylyltransferase [Parolsenella catena]